MERLCKLYDGDFWYEVKGNKGQRMGVPSARIKRFLKEVLAKIVSCKNSLADRTLICYKGKSRVSLEDIETQSKELDDSTLKNLNTIYEKIHTEHHGKPSREYELNAIAMESFKTYANERENVTEIAGRFSAECDAKAVKNTLKLALVLHVLWHRQENSLY